jgi:hypothetical protein
VVGRRKRRKVEESDFFNSLRRDCWNLNVLTAVSFYLTASSSHSSLKAESTVASCSSIFSPFFLLLTHSRSLPLYKPHQHPHKMDFNSLVNMGKQASLSSPSSARTAFHRVTTRALVDYCSWEGGR